MASIFPVIMCGGAGTRLWPASRPSRPKQFIPLSGNRSSFQETVDRVAPLAGEDGVLIVVGGAIHRRTILEQLSEIGRKAVLLLEPEGRESAAAMAAAALWTRRRCPDAVNLFVASDHHIPDDEAFREAVGLAATSAETGRIVTLGLVPTAPSSAYGYIAPEEQGLSVIRSFIEKPDAQTAARYISAGFLWNSGNFIVRADVLDQEIRASTTGLSEAVARALDDAIHDGETILLGSAFASAPKISIDYAVMEKTRLASVLPVDFEWSDLGSWDAVHESGEGDVGLHILEDSDGCLVRACDGVMVAAIGLSNVGIIVEKDAVLVTDLGRSQDVKKVVERLRRLSPRHLDFERPPEETLEGGALRLAAWIRQSALPCWCTLGQNVEGGFEEFLSLDGRRLASPHATGIQLRQLQVYAEAGRLGWQGPWRTVLNTGLENLLRDLKKNWAELPANEVDQDQGLLACSLAKIALAAPELAAQKPMIALRQRLDPATIQIGLEAKIDSNVSSAHISFLEAALAWEAYGLKGWRVLADRIVALTIEQFFDARTGTMQELSPTAMMRIEADGEILVTPGRQFEWSWLLARYARVRHNSEIFSVAEALYEAGMRGIEPKRDVVVDSMTIDGATRSSRARLAPQTTWMMASLTFASNTDVGRREYFTAQAGRALRAIWNHLLPSGLWRDKLLQNGDFIDEPASAAQFQAVMSAYAEIRASKMLWCPPTQAALSLH
ncbi:sugar phosphate nucleotidyltransferase [Brevundimonas intermedia]|nr:sugar phosphate nucleotidyltransferase [Brevundimonas intermedia]